MRFDILTIFPDMIYRYASESILRRAIDAGLIQIKAHNFRDHTTDKHRRVDDTPYGGGAGMVLSVQPIYDCLRSIGASPKTKNSKIIVMDPAGKKFDQKMAKKFAGLDRLVIIAGRYEGFDERVYRYADEKISVGDYVLAGGELPALTITEATARLIPGVLGNPSSTAEETFSEYGADIGENNHSEYPQYTRPVEFLGQKVPSILLTGDHKKIAAWRKKKTK